MTAIEEIKAALTELEAHHAENNRLAGRPEANSKTLRLVRAALSRLAELEKAEPVATAWLHHGEMVNAFPGPPCTPEQWASKNSDGYWSGKGYSEAPLYTHPAAAPQVPAEAQRDGWAKGTEVQCGYCQAIKSMGDGCDREDCPCSEARCGK